MTRSNTIALALGASLIIHLALALLIPGFRVTLPVSVERLVQVRLTEPEPPPVPPRAPPPEPVPLPTPRSAMTPVSAAEAEGVAQALARSIPSARVPVSPTPPIQLPERTTAPLPGTSTIPWVPAPTSASDLLPEAPRLQPEAPSRPDPRLALSVTDALIRKASAGPRAGTSEPGPAVQRLEIEGQVGLERKLLYEPPPPKVQIHNPVEVRIQFWVSPFGEVTRAIPIQVGDPDYDSAALAWVKRFRFSSLEAGDRREQWGTIRVKFRLE